MKYATSPKAQDAYKLLQNLQRHFAQRLESLLAAFDTKAAFGLESWLRDGGENGGGERLFAPNESLFNAASINTSQVHYENDETKNLLSASALSTIIHPNNPNAPSLHMHLSFTELRDGTTYWRIMADLNPSIFDEKYKELFDATLKSVAPTLYENAMAQGEKYFYIPSLGRHRGVSHFYLEGFFMESFEEETVFCEEFTRSVIKTYTEILQAAFEAKKEFTSKEQALQRSYHTLYLFQVLTLDRGTTAGLLIHDQNDLGILASLPKRVEKALLESWSSSMRPPQTQLLFRLINAIGEDGIIDDATKKEFAQILRMHYECYPEALALQASGDTIPTTLQNHTQSRV